MASGGVARRRMGRFEFTTVRGLTYQWPLMRLVRSLVVMLCEGGSLEWRDERGVVVGVVSYGGDR